MTLKPFVLLKDYEDTVRYEDDPRRRTRYRREIERLRESLVNYQQEVKQLQAMMNNTQQTNIQKLKNQLLQANSRLESLLNMLNSL